MKLQSILMPLSEFDHAEKGDALYGMFFVVFFLPCDAKLNLLRYNSFIDSLHTNIVAFNCSSIQCWVMLSLRNESHHLFH